jgi:hypothetical protein
VEGRQRELVYQSFVKAGLFACLVALLITSSAARLHAQEKPDGTASGQLIVNAVTVPLTHAYAIAQPGFFDKSKEDVRVLLSSVPLSQDALDDVFELIKLAREDRGHIVEVLIDASGAPISGAIYTKAFDGMVSASGMHTFTRERFERGRIAGRLAVPEPHTFSGVTWRYDATFSAAIPRPPTPEELAAALASPPAKAAAVYVAAAIKRGAMTKDARVTGVESQADGSVLVTVEGHEDGIVIGYTLQVVRDAASSGGGWKVAKQL